MNTPDEILVQSTLDGDKSAYGILVDRYKRPVFLHAIRAIQDFHDAEDITQEVFVEAHLSLRKVGSSGLMLSMDSLMTKNPCSNNSILIISPAVKSHNRWEQVRRQLGNV